MRAASGKMIELAGVGKRFGPGHAREGGRGVVVALRDVSFTVPRGAVWAVVGPNGAGKSTLFGVLLGFLRASSGDVRIDGLEPREYVHRRGAAYLPERFALPGSWPVGAALRTLARLDGAGSGAGPAAAAALERFGLTAVAERPVGELSHGLRQRVGLAQALLAPRDLVVLDEPTEGLDPLWRIRLRETLAGVRARGATVLIASHDLAEVERVADSVVLLENGAVRDILPAHVSGPGRGYRLHLEADAPGVLEIFPGAVLLADGGAPAYAVRVADVAELNGRMAALLATGARITALVPEEAPLEERVRRALEEPAS